MEGKRGPLSLPSSNIFPWLQVTGGEEMQLAYEDNYWLQFEEMMKTDPALVESLPLAADVMPLRTATCEMYAREHQGAARSAKRSWTLMLTCAQNRHSAHGKAAPGGHAVLLHARECGPGAASADKARTGRAPNGGTRTSTPGREA